MFLFISSPFRGTVEGWHAFFTGLTEGKRSSSWLPLSSSNREMGIPSEMGDAWANKEKSFVVASPDERSESSVREAVQAAFKTAVISGAVAAVPTLPSLAFSSQPTELFYRMPGKILWGSMIKQLDDPPCCREALIL
uniref:Uncharacterized protein LOC105042231 isoform X2 n=1 Tax=Elaeis guineensis var. tenera TaxID=51953 RepID=A0A6I9QYY5_ELAGV|nr:uncharacterized protein LOC105042231 isoform X2 [Elaeis guineensis]